MFVFIGFDAETGWLPGEIARDPRGYILTGGDVVKAGRWKERAAGRDPLSGRNQRTGGVSACGDVRFSPVKPSSPPPSGEGSIVRSPLSINISRTAVKAE